MTIKQYTVLATVMGCTGTLWMGGANAFFCFSGESGARSQAAPRSLHSAPAFYPLPVTRTYPRMTPTATYSGYPYSPAPYGQYLVIPEQLRQQ